MEKLENYEARRAAARNPDTSAEILQILANDVDSFVRYKTKENLKNYNN